jgi:hypothetical protein
VTPEPLDVRDEVMRRVRRKVDGRRARVRTAVTAAALVEQHDPVRVWVEEPAPPRSATRPGTAVQHEGGLAAGVSAELPVDPVPVADVEQPLVDRLDLSMERHRHHRSRAVPARMVGLRVR